MNGKTKTFPIVNSSACVFKWGWNTFRLYNGRSSSCHRVTPVFVPLEQFDHFHNTPEVLADRQKMLQGQWPGRGCEYCQRIEKQNGVSDRIYHNQIPGLTPIDFNGLDPVTPRISEIYLHNTCDLACVYCLPIFSEKINQEIKKFGPYPIGITAVQEHSQREQYFEAYVKWLKANGSKLARLSILGGEPLLQKEFWLLLDLLPEIANKDLELAINTNLNCNSDIMDRLISKSRELTLSRSVKQVFVSASIDCWGPQAEFVRYGLDLSRWQKNFERLIENRWIATSVHQVLTALTIKTALDLQNKIAKYKTSNPKIVQEYYFVDSGYEQIYHPEMFGNEFFREKLHELLDSFPIVTEWDNEARKRLEGIVRFMDQASVDLSRLQMLKNTLNTIDLRRNTDWKKLWPEINDYFVENKV